MIAMPGILLIPIFSLQFPVAADHHFVHLTQQVMQFPRQRICHESALMKVSGDLIKIAAQLIQIAQLMHLRSIIMKHKRALHDFSIQHCVPAINGNAHTRFFCVRADQIEHLLRHAEMDLLLADGDQLSLFLIIGISF